MTRIAIRVDASDAIGTGHLMRCLTLADALAARGARVRFISRELPAHFAGILARRGHEHAALPDAPAALEPDAPAHGSWLRPGQDADARQTLDVLRGEQWGWIIVDHYAIDARWESAVRGAAARVLAIDDLADRAHACDVLLDQNLLPDQAGRYRGRVPASCELWLGPRFVLLRADFGRLAGRARPRRGAVARGLICFSGADAANHTATAIDAVAGTLPGAAVDVVIGAQHPAREAILDACAARGFDCLVQIEAVADVMARADLAISACGFTCYELAAMRVPAVLVPVSRIQADVAAEFERRGAAAVLPLETPRTAATFRAAWLRLAGDASRRAALSDACAGVVDGQGTDRVADALMRAAA